MQSYVVIAGIAGVRKVCAKKETYMYQKSKNLISVKEAAELMDYSRQHVVRLINAEKIKGYQIGRSYVVERKSLSGIFKKITPKEMRDVEKGLIK